MVLFDLTSLYTVIPINDTLNIIKDYFNNDNKCTGKTAIPQDKFLDLVNLFLTATWHTFNSQFSQIGHKISWDQKKVFDRESRLILRKIKERNHSLKNPDHINKISYILLEI